jgi:hypothetical protein
MSDAKRQQDRIRDLVGWDDEVVRALRKIEDHLLWIRRFVAISTGALLGSLGGCSALLDLVTGR